MGERRQAAVDDLIRAIKGTNPFQSNRISSPNEVRVDVGQLHGRAFRRLTDRIEQVQRGKSSTGILLIGGPGTGKSHLLGRLSRWAGEHSAAFVFLHNLQVSPERMPRYVLKATISAVFSFQSGVYGNAGLLSLLLHALDRREDALREQIGANPADPEIAAVLDAFMKVAGDVEQPGLAEAAVDWMSGDEIDEDQARALGRVAGRRISTRLADGAAVERVLIVLARLLALDDKVLVLCLDQIDNLDLEQIRSLMVFLHALIDHAQNLVVICAGVDASLNQLRDQKVILQAAWDRVAEYLIELDEVPADHARSLILARTTDFLQPFAALTALEAPRRRDSLFPLGEAWFQATFGTKLQVRPRDVVTWARDQWERVQEEIEATPGTGAKWLASWPDGSRPIVDRGPTLRVPRPLEDLVDDVVRAKVEECRAQRMLNAGSLPPDADNLARLTANLLSRCLGHPEYSLLAVEPDRAPRKGATPAFDFIISERNGKGQVARTGVACLSGGHAVSTAASLNRLLQHGRMLEHILVVTDQRRPLKRGQKGHQHYDELQRLGPGRLPAHRALARRGRGAGCARLRAGHGAGRRSRDRVSARHAATRRRSGGGPGDASLAPVRRASLPARAPDRGRDRDRRTGRDGPARRRGRQELRGGLPVLALRRQRGRGDGEAPRGPSGGGPAGAAPPGHSRHRHDARRGTAAVHARRPGPLSPLDRGRRVTLHIYTPRQLRGVLACPRAHYFDATAPSHRVRTGEGLAPGGALLHQAVARFARGAGTPEALGEAVAGSRTAPELHRRIARYFRATCFDPGLLAGRPIEAQQAFVGALHAFLEELAGAAMHGRESGMKAHAVASGLFGEARPEVDVTVQLSDGEAARLNGSIDFMFFDWRTGRQRILDFQLAADGDAAGDLGQASTCAVAHQRQHDSRPDVTVYTLRPARKKVERTWEQVAESRAEVFDHLASVVAWEAYDAKRHSGLLPPGRPSLCGGCRWRDQCEPRLGPKSAGERARGWSERFARGDARDPEIVAHRPPRPAPDLDDEPAGSEATAGTATAVSAAEPARPQAQDGPRGLWVGMSGDRPIVASADILNTHVAVVGAAGSGKTWTAKILAEEAIRSGAPVLAIDPQGDLVQFLRRRDEASIEPALRPAYREFWERVEPRIYTPGSSHATRLSLSPIRLPTPDELDRFESVERRSEEQTAVLNAVAANLAGLADLRRDRAAAETFLYRILLGMPGRGQVTLERIIEAIRDPAAAGIEEPEHFIKPGSRKNLELALNNLVAGPSSALFTGGEALDLDAMIRPKAPGRVPLNVIYLNAMAHDSHKQFFVASLAAEIYRWMVTRLSAEGNRTNLLLYIDEARDFIPAGLAETPSKQPLLRLFRQGRKYGVACLLCTQSPRSVDFNAFGNCSTKLIGRLEAAQDVDRVKEWFTTDAPPAWLARRKGAGKGSFVARWAVGDDGHGVEFRGRQLFSVHEGAWSPDRVEKELRAGSHVPRPADPRSASLSEVRPPRR